jgi:hypothetical protein
VPEDDNFGGLRQQRDQAVACAWLSFAISFAIIASNFQDHSGEIGSVAKAVEVHRQLLAEAMQVRQDNIDALHQTEAALANMKKAEAGANQ